MEPNGGKRNHGIPSAGRPVSSEHSASPQHHAEGRRRPPTPLPDWVHDLVPLEHPLAILDLETTGTSPEQDRIVEIAILKIEPEGRRETHCRRVNPEMPIPPAASAVHGITDADVAQEPTFRQIAVNLAEFLADCDLAGFNLIKFDLPLLRHEFERAGIPFRMAGRRLLDALTIYHHKEPRNLSAAYRFYCNEELADAHAAEADVRATYRVLLGQLRRYHDLPRSMDALHRFCNPVEAIDMDRRFAWQGDEVFFNFGKYRGQPLRSILSADRGYLEWIANESDLSAEVRRIVREALQGIFPMRLGERSASADESETPKVRQERLPFPRAADPPEGSHRPDVSSGKGAAERADEDRRDEGKAP